jgi:hypothetical protein
MQKKGILFLLPILFYACCSQNPTSGQTSLSNNKTVDTVFHNKSTGFYNVTTFSPITLTGQFLNGIQTICGYRINHHLSIGGGVGYERFTSMLTYDNFKANLTFLPVFADIRYTFLDSKISPVIALNGGYKFLLNKATTQVRYDTLYGSVDVVSSRNDYKDSNTFKQGGLFFNIEAGIKAKISRSLALYVAASYSLTKISGDYYLTTHTDLLGSTGWVQSGLDQTTEKSIAYVQVFQVRLGIAFR